jgi:hypothetical protein
MEKAIWDEQIWDTRGARGAPSRPHNREVLVDVLGYPEEKIAELDARGVLK